MRVGERLARLLVESGIDKVFGLPGGQTLPLYEGVRRLPGRISHMLMRDERSGGYAADAYARITGRVGVCDGTVGPGATNLLSPLAEAYCSSIPLLAVVSDVRRPAAAKECRTITSCMQGTTCTELTRSHAPRHCAAAALPLTPASCALAYCAPFQALAVALVARRSLHRARPRPLPAGRGGVFIESHPTRVSPLIRGILAAPACDSPRYRCHSHRSPSC